MRRVVRDLRPAALDDLGLDGAVRAHADKLSPLRVEFQLDPDLPPLSAAVETTLYRVACEALTNVVRHARAGSCRVALTHAEGSVALGAAIRRASWGAILGAVPNLRAL